MIIGSSKLDFELLKSFEGKPKELVTYVDSLVPTWASHISGIVDNQRFYTALYVRKLLTIPYKSRMELVDALVDSIRISGVISQFTPIEDLVNSCDKNKLVTLLKEGNKLYEQGKNL